MEITGLRCLSIRFFWAAVYLVLTVNIMQAAWEHILYGLPANCVMQAQRMLAKCGQGGCADVQDMLSESCRSNWNSLQSSFYTELHISIAVLVAELLALLSGIHSAHSETLSFFHSAMHAAGALASGLLLLQRASCTYFHVVFIFCSILPFCGELLTWVGVMQGARPVKRFPPPVESSSQMMIG
eukprot:TRINITY_DN18774_c0_g1_i1.p1 TRINITY_DN18774_c0_g1~~TRINITY_DN18774_c0_g1_i1.p1  ORF type:complete len:184 (+),score=17.45 TRINITY_DN18774_c0_g1_i1:43-594(+)